MINVKFDAYCFYSVVFAEVRFTPESRHVLCTRPFPLWANSGHDVAYSITSSARLCTDCGQKLTHAPQ